MASAPDYIDYLCDQLSGMGEIRSRKMFGDYMIYVDDKPLVLVCDNVPYIKELPEVEELLASVERGFPYEGAREHYILDADDTTLFREVIARLLPVVPIPKKRKPKAK